MALPRVALPLKVPSGCPLSRCCVRTNVCVCVSERGGEQREGGEGGGGVCEREARVCVQACVCAFVLVCVLSIHIHKSTHTHIDA